MVKLLNDRWSDLPRVPIPGTHREDTAAPHQTHVRLDIQGLRAVAVLVVVAEHLWGRPSGGFVGVDVFFVLSGYLITGLMLREHERHGTISFRGFYERRIKRIIPAAVTTIFLTCTLTPLILGFSRGFRTFIDGLWALGFAGNWRLYFQDTDYFARSQPPSPLQHYWSLGVEEQFYFVWPWVLLALFSVAMRHPRLASHKSLIAAGAILVIGGVSFWWAMVETAASQFSAYFSSFTRAWELGVGALLAICAPYVAKIRQGLRPILAWAGLLGIFACVLLIDENTRFPGPWAAAPVLATALVVAAGEGGYPSRLVPLLTSKPSCYIGDLSYSLYLVHFPVIILLAGVLAPTSLAYSVACLIAIPIFTLLSYYLVETPIRRSDWLDRPPDSPRRQPLPHGVKRGAVVLTVYVLVVGAATGYVRFSGSQGGSPLAVAIEAGQTAPCYGAAAIVDRSLCDPLVDPVLTPSPLEVAEDEQIWKECLGLFQVEVVPVCRDGAKNPKLHLALLGDSHAGMYRNGLRAAATKLGWQIDTYYGVGCRPGVLFFCNSYGSTVAALAAGHYDAILVAGFYDAGFDDVDGLRGRQEGDEIAVSTAWKDLIAATGSKLIVIRDIPRISVDATACTRLVTTSVDTVCATPRDQAEVHVTMDKAAALTPEAAYVDLTDIFCTSDVCNAIIGSVIAYSDEESHLTDTFSATLGPYLAARIAGHLPST